MFMMRFFVPGFRKQIGGPAIRLYAEKILEKYLANPNKSKANTMIKLIVENEQYKSDDERVDEIMMFLIAGHDSTGITLSTILVLLAKNPLVAQKLRQEFASVPVDQRCKVPLFEYVIKESMRVMPPISSILRQIGQDLVLKSGHKIPKGAICTIPNIVYMYNDAVFKDPDQFKPERWANPTKEMMDSFMPFGLGQRNCVGQMLAKAEINTVIPSLLANYDFTVEDEGETSLNIFFEFTNIKLKVTKL
jgi:cytochrome P450